ncbi:hypothetical protein HEO76_021690, partial [Escherichia coli]|nr:hypothetical protein [Escherichia coli]
MADISTPNLDYNDMLEAWDINDALMGGTLEMRRQGENYLPKWPKEGANKRGNSSRLTQHFI